MGMSFPVEGFQWVHADFLPKKGDIRGCAHSSSVRAEGWRGGPAAGAQVGWREETPGLASLGHTLASALPFF